LKVTPIIMLEVVQHPKFFELCPYSDEFDRIRLILTYIKKNKDLNITNVTKLLSVCQLRHLSLKQLEELKESKQFSNKEINLAIDYCHRLLDYLNGKTNEIDYKPTVIFFSLQI
jgi:hypothetical protein